LEEWVKVKVGPMGEEESEMGPAAVEEEEEAV